MDFVGVVSPSRQHQPPGEEEVELSGSDDIAANGSTLDYELMTVWTEVVVELYDNDERKDDCLVYRDVESMKGANETAEQEGQRKLMFADPVHRFDLKPFIREHLQQAIVACGGNEAFQEQWVVNVDKDVLSEFSKLGIF
ncbi:MAG: hypothetical protein Q9180_007311 [Flavoplaca navasiana]